MIMEPLRWSRIVWKPISKVGQSIRYTDVFLTFLSKADRVTHKNTKTFIQSWLENLSCKRSSLKPINYDVNNKNMLQLVATGAYHSPVATTRAHCAQNGEIRV